MKSRAALTSNLNVVATLFGAMFEPRFKQAGVAPVKLKAVSCRAARRFAHYVENIKYPQFSGTLSGADIDNLNRSIRAYVRKYLRSVRESMELEPGDEPDLEGSIRGDYILRNVAPDLVSIQFTFDLSAPGADHSQKSVHGFNYNPRAHKAVDVGDCLSGVSDVAQFLSDFSRQQLMRSGQIDSVDMAWLQTGTAPKLHNFKNFVVTKNAVIFFFEDYQIAPYEEENFSVTVPLPLS